jgi:hypothetical protein
LLLVATLLLGGASARAQAVYFEVASGSLEPDASVTLELWLDVGDQDLQAWFLQVAHVGNTASAASQEPFVFAGGVLASSLGSPVPNSIDGGDATGQYAFTVNPPGFIPAGTPPFEFGTISFASLSPGTILIEVSPGGAVGPPCGAVLPGCADDPLRGYVFDSIEIVPEPGARASASAALIALAALRAWARRRASGDTGRGRDRAAARDPARAHARERAGAITRETRPDVL